jgi:hypothetical protein
MVGVTKPTMLEVDHVRLAIVSLRTATAAVLGIGRGTTGPPLRPKVGAAAKAPGLP